MIKIGRLIIIIVWVLVLLSYLTTQLTNDFFVFWAYGRFVSNSSLSGIPALIETWEMKGLLFKVYLYIEYALTSLFSTSFDTECQTIYKAIGLVPYLSILLFAVFAVPEKYVKGIKRKDLFFVTSICLLAVHFASHFQAEMWGVLLLLLSFSFYLNDGWKYKIIAALIYSLTFYLKTPIPVLGGAIIAATLYLNSYNDIKKFLTDFVSFAVATLIFLFLSLLYIYICYPQEIRDIWDASYYQSTLFHNHGRILSSCHSLVDSAISTLPYYPITIVGISALIALSFKLIKGKQYYNFLLLILVWFFPLLYILLSNCFFVYHYYMLVLSAILTLLLAINELYISRRVCLMVFVLSIIYYITFLSSISHINIFEKKIYSQSLQVMKDKNNITVGSRLGAGSIMFLDSGIGAFLFCNRSYLRYFYPLPLQRINSSDEFSKTQTYKLIKEKALAYSGDYLTLDKEWFMSKDNNDDIYNKINNEYLLFKKISFNGYSWSLFKKEKAPATLLVYKRRKDL